MYVHIYKSKYVYVYRIKVNAILQKAYFRPWDFQVGEISRFRESQHLNVILLSALRTGRLYLPGNSHFS